MSDDRRQDGSRLRVIGSSFEDLEVFRKAYRLSLEIHQKSLGFPAIEQGALADQMRRASKSVCANLVEGFSRQQWSKTEFRRYLHMAISSADEMRLWCRYCLELGYVDQETWQTWRDGFQEVARMLQGLGKAERH